MAKRKLPMMMAWCAADFAVQPLPDGNISIQLNGERVTMTRAMALKSTRELKLATEFMIREVESACSDRHPVKRMARRKR